MIPLALIIIFWLACLLYFLFKEKNRKFPSWELVIMGAGFGGFIASLFVLVFSQMILWKVIGSTHEEYSNVELVNINDRAGMSGSFFLGSGTVEDEPVFYYYERENGRVTLERIKADDAVIIEDESSRPYVSYLEEVSNNSLWYLGGMESSRIEFHVPPNSIITNYSLGE